MVSADKGQCSEGTSKFPSDLRSRRGMHWVCLPFGPEARKGFETISNGDEVITTDCSKLPDARYRCFDSCCSSLITKNKGGVAFCIVHDSSMQLSLGGRGENVSV